MSYIILEQLKDGEFAVLRDSTGAIRKFDKKTAALGECVVYCYDFPLSKLSPNAARLRDAIVVNTDELLALCLEL